MVFAVMFYTMVRKKCHPFCTCCSCRNWMEQRRCSLSNCLATSWPQGEKPNFSDSSDRLLVFKLRRNLTATCDLLHLVHFGPRGFCLRVRLEWRWTSLPMGQGHGQRRIHRKHHGFTQGHCAELVFVKTIWSNAAWVLQFNMLTNEFRTLCWHVMTMRGQLVPAGLRRWKLPCSGPRCAELEAKWMPNKHLTVSYSSSYDKAGCVWPHWS